MSFDADLRSRNAADYADFLLPHLAPAFHVLDAGCGAGTLAVGLAATVDHVIGIDLDGEAFADAARYATIHGIENVVFRAGSVYRLPFADDQFDACLCPGHLVQGEQRSAATTGTHARRGSMGWPVAPTSRPWNRPGWNGRNRPRRMRRLRGVGR
jgi:ubiquinone/menaquinone biosynthesis C-methylase UbiE